MAWFFSSAGGLIFFKHWPTFFLTFALRDEYVPDDVPLTYDDVMDELFDEGEDEYVNLDVLYGVDNTESDDSGENVDEYALGYFDEEELPF